MTLSRAGASDFALIAANPAFTALTRYERDAILGRNCRFLQGEYREQVVKRQIHAFLSDDGEDNFRGLIVNVRADGKPFINLLYLAKLRDQAGVCRYVLGSQFDASRTHLSDLRAYDGELAKTFEYLRPRLSEDSVMARGSYETLAGAAAAIARAKMMLAEL
jgi:PAS domain S-box-containing protein